MKSIHHFPIKPPSDTRLVSARLPGVLLLSLFEIDGGPRLGAVLVSLLLGCAGIFLLVLMLTIILVTLAREDQILIDSDQVVRTNLKNQYFRNPVFIRKLWARSVPRND